MLFDSVVGRVGCQSQQVFVDCPDIFINGYVVVIDYDKDIRLAASCIVEPFKGKSSGKRPVTDKRDCLFPVSREFGRLCKAERCRDGCG